MKLLLVVASLQLVLGPVFTLPSGDHWEEWGPYGECSRTCGTGVTVRTRRCLTQRSDGGHNCVGPDKSFRSCNIQDCPEGSRDFREEQCSHFDGTDFHGKRYKWLPYHGAENPCELNCIPRAENFYYRHRSSVVDGTRCHPGRRDVCVEGVCRRLGCDNMLESQQEEDACLQCGGDGRSCHRVSNTFSVRNLPKGYNQMFIIPVGATSIRISETVATRNYLAVKNLRGEYYLNGHWVIEFSRAAPIAGTTLYYQRAAEGEMAPESIVGRGPTTEPLVIELIIQEPNQGVECEYYLPNDRSREGYYWSYGSWSTCSRECGSGYQSRLVFCAIDNEAYPDYLCASLPRPVNNRTCNEQQCPLTHSWKIGEWNQCSATCGGGSQGRRVECVAHDSSGSRVVDDSLCEAYTSRPLSQQKCNMQRCAEYSVSAWSQCSVTCGSGQQTRDVVCVGSGGAHLEDYMCGTVRTPRRTQPCEMPACRGAVAWHVGDWGLCSKSCSSGLRERQVICSDTQRNLYGAEHCNTHPKPSTVESCNTQPCYSPQEVPSMQDPRGYDNTLHGFHRYPAEDHGPEHQPPIGTTHLTPHCTQTTYGCCPDGRTPAGGFRGQGCPTSPSCIRTRYGCCQDGVSQALGPNKEGCPEYIPPTPAPADGDCHMSTYGCCYDGRTAAVGADGEGCLGSPTSVLRGPCELPNAPGPCDQWAARYHYDPASSRCVHFWYGGCHGNSNNFASVDECQQTCRSARPVSVEYGGGTQGHAHQGHAHLGAIATSHAHHSHRKQHARRPAARAAQLSSTAASWTSVGVSIDKSDPSRVEGLAGQLVVLPCRVHPPPSSTVAVEWRRDGAPLNPSRHRQQADGSLLVGPVTVEDSGWLLCVATRDRERDHRYIYLSVSEVVQEPLIPQDGADPANSLPAVPHVPHTQFSIDRAGPVLVEARAAQTARLYCTVLPTSVSASVSIQWTKNGAVLNTPRHSQESDGTLVISTLTSDDSGVYTCTASRGQQLEQLQIHLRVLGDLRIITAPSNVQVSRGGTAQLPCVVSGENVKVVWSRNGLPVRPDGLHIQVSADGALTLNNVQPADEGSYTCNAYTGSSSVSASAEVRVNKDYSGGPGLSPDCVDEPELANCELIVSARLCGHRYFSSFCCASCFNYAMSKAWGPARVGGVVKPIG
ncbi:papilin isoform X2 [Brachyhypopomus gauderio]|uniref:papilin isoform X2 n=1 Tax=Brachyhypopomus gauderio TaxID=698409 RepID=UPI0040422593